MNRNAPATELVALSQSERIATLTLSNPASRNALSRAMMSALAGRLAALATRDDVRVVLLQAEGPAFCAGHDLKELTTRRGDADGGRAFFEETMRACSALMQQIVALPQPVIAVVEGMATAAGCQLVATCDLAVAGPAARFCTPGVDIGLFCTTPAVALSRNVAPKQAMEMLLTGVPIDAGEALRIGLVNRVAPEGARTGALALAEVIAAKSPQAIRFGKRAFYAQREKPLCEAYELASAVMTENMLAADAKEGIAAFLEKRAPSWAAKER
jgi:enoyl-CoA hydratase/carnithine racemase